MYGLSDLPELEGGASYAHVAAGGCSTVLLRSYNVAIAFGDIECGQCDVPEMEAGASYVQVAARVFHAALLRSDGMALAFIMKLDGQCIVPKVGLVVIYVANGVHQAVSSAEGLESAAVENTHASGQQDGNIRGQCEDGLRCTGICSHKLCSFGNGRKAGRRAANRGGALTAGGAAGWHGAQWVMVGRVQGE